MCKNFSYSALLLDFSIECVIINDIHFYIYMQCIYIHLQFMPVVVRHRQKILGELYICGWTLTQRKQDRMKLYSYNVLILTRKMSILICRELW